MSRKAHTTVSRSVVRAVVAAGAVLVVSVSPMLTGSAFAEGTAETDARPAPRVVEQLTGGASDLVSEIHKGLIRRPGPINGWQ
ncbi:hypothetical protein [Streptomyces sp. JH34]|uniref:hypothetical protein n=1 Tax=Streptomyces sp. JH34 TaxID=2793633 RepID=UPI0023F68E75|nr:hypothetical protein [Streptomyces sp. JH34]MDF6019120.1 hypothetical protein [Streptomyces sp. JH34]